MTGPTGKAGLKSFFSVFGCGGRWGHSGDDLEAHTRASFSVRLSLSAGAIRSRRRSIGDSSGAKWQFQIYKKRERERERERRIKCKQR